MDTSTRQLALPGALRDTANRSFDWLARNETCAVCLVLETERMLFAADATAGAPSDPAHTSETTVATSDALHRGHPGIVDSLLIRIRSSKRRFCCESCERDEFDRQDADRGQGTCTVRREIPVRVASVAFSGVWQHLLNPFVDPCPQPVPSSHS